MKTKLPLLLSAALLAGIGATIAQSKYSGIYSGKVSYGGTFVAAVTKGGRVLASDSTAESLRDVTNPAISTVNASGKLKARTHNGASITGSISSTYRITGTVKSGGSTARFSGKRTYK